MKTFILPALCALTLATGTLQAQNFNRTAASAGEIFPLENTLVMAEGDMNKDGVKDLVVMAEGYLEGTNFAFYFGNKQGGYTLFRDYEIGLRDDVELSVTAQGVARIQANRTDGADIFLFRYEGGDFRLIGGKEDRHKSSDDYDISYNYLTEKMIRTDGHGSGRKSETLDLPKLPKIHFGWIPLDYDMLAYLVQGGSEGEDLDPDSVLVMGIFRVMQANGMLFWHFCDWENPYRDPVGSEEGWYAYDDHMAPGSYNYWATLEISKLPSGSFQLDMDESMYDRSYEALFNEDMSNIDEIMEEYETEEETGSCRWIFKDGRFTEVERPAETASPGSEAKG